MVRRVADSVVLVNGLPGAGKTTLAHDLRDRTGWACLSSRRATSGLTPHQMSSTDVAPEVRTPSRARSRSRGANHHESTITTPAIPAAMSHTVSIAAAPSRVDERRPCATSANASLTASFATPRGDAPRFTRTPTGWRLPSGRTGWRAPAPCG